MRARIVVYDDYTILDETEVLSDNKKQIEDIAKDMVLSNDAQSCEVYDTKTKSMIMRFNVTRKGKVVAAKVKKSRAGGARPNAGRKPSPNSFTRYIAIRVTQDVGQWLDENTGLSMAAWIRAAINEKIERDEKKSDTTKAGH